jgi:hypothetical protein
MRFDFVADAADHEFLSANRPLSFRRQVDHDLEKHL